MSLFASVADFRPKLDMRTTEDSCEFNAVQVAEPSFSGIGVLSAPSKRKSECAEDGESSTAPVNVELTEKNLSRHKARSTERLLIEEIPELTTSSQDSKAVYAFKLCFHEVFALRNASRLSVVVHADEDQSSAMNKPLVGPTPLDFLSDVFLCAKRALGAANYSLLCQHAEEGWIFWPQVPERVRQYIAERVGAKLIERGIFKRRGTRVYWHSDFFLRARKATHPCQTT